jgi:hypothetical protein
LLFVCVCVSSIRAWRLQSSRPAPPTRNTTPSFPKHRGMCAVPLFYLALPCCPLALGTAVPWQLKRIWLSSGAPPLKTGYRRVQGSVGARSAPRTLSVASCTRVCPTACLQVESVCLHCHASVGLDIVWCKGMHMQGRHTTVHLGGFVCLGVVQEGVPAAVRDLRAAGMKLWMLTGTVPRPLGCD